VSLGLADFVSLAKLLWALCKIPPGVLMFHSPTQPRFAMRILIKLSAQGVAILGSILVALSFPLPSASAWGQAINCPSGFNSSTGACGVAPGIPGATGYPLAIFGDSNSSVGLSGSAINLQPTGTVHAPDNINFVGAAVNVQAFTTTFRFVPNNWNLAFYLENATSSGGGSGPAPGFSLAKSFTSGAGCEGAFYQAFGGIPGNNIFVLNFDNGNLQVNSLTPSWYSNVQIYQQLQDPCIAADGTEPYYQGHQNKVSTSPVPMASPATTRQTSTGDTYSATIIYTGTTVILNLYDVTAGGSCPGARCFTYTWPNISIPTLVDGTTAIAGFGGATNSASSNNLLLNSWVYTVLSAPATPTFSPTGGTYGSTQTITISDSSSGSVICYNTTGAPSTNGQAGCTNGTLYSGTISVPKGETIYAVAGGTGYGDSAVASSVYNIASTASTPFFNQPGGTWQGNQTVQLTAAQGGVICYSTSTTPATNGSTGCTTGTLYTTPITVSSNQTINAVAGGTGFTDSAVGSAAYVISPFAVVAGYTGVYPANSPTFSPLPGTYSSTQSVTISTATSTGVSSPYICYLLSASTPTSLPEPNSLGGCSIGTLYTSPVSVSSTQTLYAVAGTTTGAYGTAGTGPPSSVVQGAYTISSSGGTRPAPPTLNRATVY
jgi:Chitobiase/beta-hexosaminidase C-terminal domain